MTALRHPEPEEFDQPFEETGYTVISERLLRDRDEWEITWRADDGEVIVMRWPLDACVA